MTDSGIRHVLKKRSKHAGIQHVYPHMVRRSFAHQYLDNGGTIDGVMYIAGWKTYDMPKLYTEELGRERAHRSYDNFSPGDRI